MCHVAQLLCCVSCLICTATEDLSLYTGQDAAHRLGPGAWTRRGGAAGHQAAGPEPLGVRGPLRQQVPPPSGVHLWLSEHQPAGKRSCNMHALQHPACSARAQCKLCTCLPAGPPYCSLAAAAACYVMCMPYILSRSVSVLAGLTNRSVAHRVQMVIRACSMLQDLQHGGPYRGTAQAAAAAEPVWGVPGHAAPPPERLTEQGAARPCFVCGKEASP